MCPLRILQEVDVSGDNVSLEIQVESSHAVVAHVLAREKYRYLHRHRYGIVDEHEPLQGLVTLLLVGCRGQRKTCEARCKVFLPRHWWTDLCGEL